MARKTGTGKHLKIVDMGDNVLGVKLEGDPKKPEPIHFRVCLPGGDVDIVRTTGNDYWVHVRVDRPQKQAGDPYQLLGKLADFRVDDCHESVTKVAKKLGGIVNKFKDLYHFAARITTNIPENRDTEAERMQRVRKACGIPEPK